MAEGICILGSTGSIGCSALDVISRNQQAYDLVVLTANTNVEKLFEQCIQFRPQFAILRDKASAEHLREKLRDAKIEIKVLHGEQAIRNAALAEGVVTVIAAIVGAAGLLPTLTAVESGLKVLLANKEALVMSGGLFMQAVRNSGAMLLPVDSEHNAIFQALANADESARPNLDGVSKILLTGSGGPFRTLPLEELATVTPQQACAHPNWDMGRKISVDSATMMNKGLELIEACFLFGINLEQIEIVVHPQSIVHSMVSYRDGSVLAQMGNPDMRTPIAHSLAWPKRIDAGVEALDFFKMAELTFEHPDHDRFPALELAASAMRKGGTAPCVLNAANEIAVAAFLDGQLAFTEITEIISSTCNTIDSVSADSVEHILEADLLARETASEQIQLKRSC